MPVKACRFRQLASNTTPAIGNVRQQWASHTAALIDSAQRIRLQSPGHIRATLQYDIAHHAPAVNRSCIT